MCLILIDPNLKIWGLAPLFLNHKDIGIIASRDFVVNAAYQIDS